MKHEGPGWGFGLGTGPLYSQEEGGRQGATSSSPSGTLPAPSLSRACVAGMARMSACDRDRLPPLASGPRVRGTAPSCNSDQLAWPAAGTQNKPGFFLQEQVGFWPP